jgi:hypothetical protein
LASTEKSPALVNEVVPVPAAPAAVLLTMKNPPPEIARSVGELASWIAPCVAML